MARDISFMPGDIRRSVERLGRASQKAAIRGVQDALDVGAAEHDRIIRRDSGGNMKLSGVNKAKGRAGNASVGTSTKVTNRSGSHPSGLIKATGPLHLIANPTGGRVIRSAYSKGKGRRGGTGRSQFIGPSFGGQFKGDRRAVLNIPGIGYRRSARHPGTAGKDTWQNGKQAAAPKIRTSIGRAADREMTQAFRQGA